MKQCASTILMIRPVNFRMNEQTAVNNYYQTVLDDLSPEEVNSKAQEEFDQFVSKLKNQGVKVVVVEDTIEPDTPDSIFPNNWVSFHADGRIGLYPMFAENRRLERREEVLSLLRDGYDFKVDEIVDFTEFEDHEKYLEGTGSIVLDRKNSKAYAAISPRTDAVAFAHFCEEFDYDGILFSALQDVEGKRELIYHTNVMMCVGDGYVVICLDTIDDVDERNEVERELKSSGLEIIEITEDQKHRFAGNMLNVCNESGESFTVMSGSAYSALSSEQIEQIEKHGKIIHSSLDTIEACGGGSARCMMAEVFLPKTV